MSRTARVFVASLCVLSVASGAVIATAADAPTHSLVAVAPTSSSTLRQLQRLGCDIASFDPDTGMTYVIATPSEVRLLQERGFALSTVQLDAHAGLKQLQAVPDLGAYHTFDEMVLELEALHAQYPNETHLEVIGRSVEQRPIYALKISDDAAVEDASEADVLIVGCHHARELISVEVPLYFAATLLSRANFDPQVRRLVEERETWVVPMLNPDGHVYQETEQLRPGWRKNRRLNLDGSVGVDLNRNYAFMFAFDDNGSSPDPFSETYRGDEPFSEPESAALRALVERQEFTISISYHSFGGLVLYPWGFTAGETTPDHGAFAAIADSLVRTNRYRPGNAYSGTIYLTNGEFDDYMYGELTARKEQSTLAFTVELNGLAQGGFWPPDTLVQPTCDLMTELNLFAVRVAAENPRQLSPPPAPVLTARQDTLDPSLVHMTWTRPLDAYNPIEYFEVFEVDPLGQPGLQASRKANLHQAGRALLLEAWMVPARARLPIVLESDLEALWDYAYVEVREKGGAWQAVPGEGTRNLDPTARNSGHGLTGSRPTASLWFDVAQFAGRQVDVAVRLDPDAESPRQPFVRARVDVPRLLAESRRVISPRLQETSYSLTAPRGRVLAYGVSAVDAQEQKSDSDVFWVYLPPIETAVEIANPELNVEGLRLTLRWQRSSAGDALFTAWIRPLEELEAVGNEGNVWSEGRYARVAVMHSSGSGRAEVTWNAVPGRYAVLLAGEDADGPRLWGPWVAGVAARTELHAAVPNPFNPRTTLRFELAEPTHVRLEVLSIDGRQVCSLLSAVRDAGEHTMRWDGRNDAGRRVASGVYVVRMQTHNSIHTQRIVLLR